MGGDDTTTGGAATTTCGEGVAMCGAIPTARVDVTIADGDAAPMPSDYATIVGAKAATRIVTTRTNSDGTKML